MLKLAIVSSCMLTFLSGICVGEDWPCWRGPRGDGSSADVDAPLHWNGETGENISWKVPLPGTGHASPIVSKDCVFIVACLEKSQQRVLICLDRTTGETRWTKSVVTSPLESKHRLNSYASSTPAADGEHVFVSFLEVDGKTVPAPNVGTPRDITTGTMVVACYDFDGNQKWVTRPGDFLSAHGYCSSPVLYQDLVIVNGDHDGNSYIVALDKETGDEVWRTERVHKTRSYVTPLLRDDERRPQLVVSGSKRVVSLDPRSGEMIWHVEGPTEQFVASMVDDGEQFFMAAGFPTHHVMAIDPSGMGDVTESHVNWHVTNVRCYVPSPVVVDQYLMVADDRGTANCFDTKSGERYWVERLGRHFSASLVSIQGVVAFISDDGIVKLVKPGPELEVVAENPLGEWCFSSPAISDGQWFIRGENHLFCIEKK